MPPITLYFLQSSRALRIAWLLEELNLDYELKFSERMDNLAAPEEFKVSCGNPLGKSPSLKDGELTVYESGAITEYLCETYDKQHRMIPQDPTQRINVLQYLHAAEATFLLHALPIVFTRLYTSSSPTTPPSSSDTLTQLEHSLSQTVQTDLDWLETELSLARGRFLCGNEVTAADTMMMFSVACIFEAELGTMGREWVNIGRWLGRCRETVGYRRAVERSGFQWIGGSGRG